MPIEASGPNAEQIRYWNEQAGPGWVAMREALDRQIRALGLLGIERVAPLPGESALDVGCGCGDTTLELAARVGTSGRVLGVDISEPMLREAEERRRESPAAARVELTLADAQTHRFEPGAFDLAFSRFGVMFFAEPAAAFRNLRAALSPGGRVCFVCWQSLAENPWLRVPLETVAGLVPAPPPGDPLAPGPFAFADEKRVLGLLEGAGFEAAAASGLRETIRLGGGTDLERTARFMLEMGPAAQLVRGAGIDDPAQLEKLRAAMAAALAPHATPEGVIMDCAVWIYQARRPD